MKSFGLLARIIIAIILGVIIGSFANEWLIRLFATFNDLFGNFLSFVIPLIILGFIVPGIGSMGKGAGKLLGYTAGFAYISTVIAGIIAYIVAKILYPVILQGQSLQSFDDPSEGLRSAFFSVEMPPLMDVMTSLLLAFIIGIGISVVKSDSLLKIANDFQSIIQLVIEKVIIPLLPIHIFGIFANMTFTGQVATILSVFLKVFILIVLLHLTYLTIQYTIAGSFSKQNPFKMMKIMSPAYFTALGTQSSAATIPVSLKRAKELNIKENVANLSIPLLANIHLSGSTITIVSCSLAVIYLQGDGITFGSYIGFIFMLGLIMVAAPGVPGGAIIAATGIIESMLGFSPAMVSLMIALYIAQDSLGTACNVTGDGAITSIVDSINKRRKVTETNVG